MGELLNALQNFWESTGVFRTVNSLDALWWQTLVMIAIVVVLVYLAIVKGFEPLLLLPIAIGMLLTNLPGGGMFHSEYWFCDITELNELIAAGKDLAVIGPEINGHIVPWTELYSFTWENGEIVSYPSVYFQ
ncbi:MAG: sodium ion-translocating decarboxylase subunit beta, partial [Clostridia bacterium]|nr:sodium ion-translocating decarboxylase subunit beta [Clostridia bacterium]